VAGAGEALDLAAQRVGGERAGGEMVSCAVSFSVERGDFFADDADVRLGGDGFGDAARELDAIDGQRVACGNGGLIGNAQEGEPARRISCLSSQGAVLGDSLLSELEQTSSPNSVVWWAGVRRGLPSTMARIS
jgi:hypothetical protein